MGRSSPKLTGKQELFVQGLIKGLSQRQAYIKAGYSTKNKTGDYLDQKASHLFKNDKVLARYNDLMEKHEKKALWTREMAFKALTDVMVETTSDRTFNVTVSAIKELNAIGNIYPKETDVDISDPVYLAQQLKKLPKEKLEVLMNEFSKDD